MTQLDKNMSEIFDVEPTKPEGGELVEKAVTEIVESKPTELVEIENPDDKQMEEDFAKMRKNQEDLILKGKIALDCALDIVQQSDQPRAIEVFSTLLGQLSRINQEAMDLHAKRRDIKNARPESPEGPKTVNNTNAIFVGTTSELNKMLEQLTGKK
jgi:hypothetical protein